MSKSQSSTNNDLSTSLLPLSSQENGVTITPNDEKLKLKGSYTRQSPHTNPLAQVVVCKRLAKMPMLFLAKRRQMRKIELENAAEPYTDDNAGLMAASSILQGTFAFEREAKTFEEYTQQLEEALTILRTMKREEYESQTALIVLRFLENLIHQPKEWISGAKLKLSEMKFPETAMTLMNSYKEKGYLVRRIVFLHSILLYNSMSNFTDHEFDKEGLIRKQAADAGFIEFACEILNDSSYLESLTKCYIIDSPEQTTMNIDFNNYQKILYICDSALTILYNMANLPELKIHFRECNATNIIAEYTKLSSDTILIQFPETDVNQDCITSIKELQDVISAIRVTSCLLLPLIMNEDEDNILAANTSDVLPLLSEMIRKYNGHEQRFYGFSFIELVDGLSKLMVRGRTHKYIDKNLVNILLNILENTNQEDNLLECVSNAILNASFDEKVQILLDTDHVIDIITSARNNSPSQLVQKNCEAILWTLNRIPHRRVSTISKGYGLDGHIMISYNRSVTAMCLKMRDRLKALHYNVWLDVDNINGGVLESMAEAVENSSIILICMNEQYKQSYYCRLEAEYATELRKPCIPCLMQPRFRPYGWLGIIKGAKIHVDFATLPFEEAFSILIREIETIKQVDRQVGNNEDNIKDHPPHGTRYSTIDTINTITESKQNKPVKSTSQSQHITTNWDTTAVQQWLEQIGLSDLKRAFMNIDGKLLWQLYQMKQLASDSYYKFLDKYIDRLHIALSMPPTILKEPDSDIIFDPRINLELICLAKGDPTLVYTWTKNGLLYTIDTQNNNVIMANDSGTLIFTQPQSIDQGWYQCNATNIWGTAVSRRVHVRLAELGAFPIYDRAQIIQVRRGDSLKIPCKPPIGVPDPEIYWTDNANVGDQFGFRVANPRIQQDYDGNLYFLNVKDEDEQKQFICNAFSRKLNVIRRGTLTKLQVIQSDPIDRKPTKLWSSDAYKVFLKGKNLSLKCIFDGLPTPDVIWRKINGRIPERRSSIILEKQELIINDLQYEDEGVYECRGHNELGYDTFSINVQIEADPYWIEKPKDIHVTEGETVDVTCHTEAKPTPKVTQWLINGIPLQDISVPYNPRRVIMKNRLVIQNITKSDTAVYQCNVSNIHGFIFANFFINVISEKPKIQRGPDTLYRVVEGQSVILPCETNGVPTPKVYWHKRNRIITGVRYSISKDGSLTIQDVSSLDNGIYICNATNKFGSDIRNTTLNIKQKTRIQTRPNNQQIRRGSQAIFRCTAIADNSLTYDINWYKDGKLLTYTGRFIKDITDQNTLKIVDVQFDDAGSYVCRASTELDFDDASATLIVQDRPNRPKITKIICNGSNDQPFAIVQWQGTGDNNARIIYYELQYNTSFQTKDWISVPIEQRKESFNEVTSPEGSINLESKTAIFNTTNIPSNQNDLRVSLSCWANYTFRIIAYNRVGASDASPISESMCTTKTCRPKTNPIGVKASTTQSVPLLIEWDNMPAIKRGSPTFWYEVGWRQFPLGTDPGPFSMQIIYPPQHQFPIPNSIMNMRYQYYVKAVNQQLGEINSTDAIEPPVYNIAFAGDSGNY
ncbi:unnamed protein product [Rotaria sordida]|uniref:Ig-like domain-containing protein n=1 Tax=Rotaria sordida TaxID=392033 RepID=A0A819Q9Y6_9BILA|nr:unnamed protein product [Rotaria sordida]